MGIEGRQDLDRKSQFFGSVCNLLSHLDLDYFYYVSLGWLLFWTCSIWVSCYDISLALTV